MERSCESRDDGILNQLERMFVEFPEVERVWLFGSRACGDADERSDVDLAVETIGLTRSGRLKIAEQMENVDTLLKIDLLFLDEAGDDLAQRVRREGVVLYERTKVTTISGQSRTRPPSA